MPVVIEEESPLDDLPRSPVVKPPRGRFRFWGRERHFEQNHVNQLSRLQLDPE